MALFNINNVICINLQNLTDSQISDISLIADLNSDVLIDLRNKGYIKVWVERAGEWFIAVLTKNNHFVVCDNFLPISKKEKKKLLDIKPVKPTIQKKSPVIVESKSPSKSSNKIFLDLDSILDKINISGLSSLSTEELEYLKSF